MHELKMQNGNPVGNFNRVTLRNAYNDSRPLKPKKVKDLEKLLSFLPPEHATFYEYIILENIQAF